MFKTEWTESLKKYKDIVIFGAKGNAISTYSGLMMIQRDILCFIVSERGDNPYELSGKPVKTFDQIDARLKERVLVVISQRYEDNDKMERVLVEAGFHHMIAGPQQSKLSEENLLSSDCAVFGGQRISVREFAVHGREYAHSHIPVRIYAVTSDKNLHLAKRKYISKYVKYIQAGAALSSERFCDITDDKGDNISMWNPFFCELTAGYWVYRNDVENEYIGLYHYSRGFDIRDEQIEQIVEAGVDVVLPIPYLFRHGMADTMLRQEIDVIIKAIERVSPEYINSAKRFSLNKAFVAGNLIFARREIFCGYYKWLFSVLKECALIKQENKTKIEERIFGYYGENLMNIYFIHNRDRYKTLYSEVIGMF